MVDIEAKWETIRYQLKKTYNLKFENYVLFGRLNEDLSQEYSLSALRDCYEEVREEPG